ncbi:hypothetical protein QN277_016620 [Acacia crassicarpa]|uniref:PGG domain-containing protein n=1 Tax=Acacia crassicarpa TaxID=499986 RepID=A0AAE1TCE3_9FABA|nr:hypothetical protein QN277_016620 [Acacia crassicarpa]
MDESLVKAARDGDVTTLHNLLKEDPQILERASLDHFADSPLHVASLSGKSEFVEQIVTLMPSLAIETNQKGMIPLHLASSKGHVETVRKLLKANLVDDGANQCLVKVGEGWTPLHCASQKGKISVIEGLISDCPECLEQVTAKGETVLHVAVKANQFEAVKVLADNIRHHNLQILLKAEDQKGKTAYQLAAAKKQSQALEVLKEDDEIREEHHINVESDGEAGGKKEEGKKGEETQRNAILVVAALIITLTYQSMASPPSSFAVTDHGSWIGWNDTTIAVLALLFIIFNSCVFLQSVYVVVTTLRGPIVFPVRVLTLFLMLCYSILLAGFCYNSQCALFAYVVLGIALLISCILAQQNFFIQCMPRCRRQQPEASSLHSQ